LLDQHGQAGRRLIEQVGADAQGDRLRRGEGLRGQLLELLAQAAASSTICWVEAGLSRIANSSPPSRADGAHPGFSEQESNGTQPPDESTDQTPLVDGSRIVRMPTSGRNEHSV
jgi:hypothetical protein